jgi:hypothetical protein
MLASGAMSRMASFADGGTGMSGGTGMWMWHHEMMYGYGGAMIWSWVGIGAGIVVLLASVLAMVIRKRISFKACGAMILVASTAALMAGAGGFLAGALGLVGGGLVIGWRW